MIPAAVLAGYAAAASALVAAGEKFVALWERIRGKGKPPAPPNVDPGATSQAPGPVRRRIPRQGGDFRLGELILFSGALVALYLLLTGCATFKADTMDELLLLCDTYYKCEPCKDSPAPPVNPGGEGSSPSPAPVEPGNQDPPDPVVPPGPDAGVGLDEIDLSTVTWHHPSPAAFRVTADLRDVRIAGQTITWAWSHPGWTEEDGNKGGVVGNLWVFAKINGRWHAATFEWLRRNTVRSKLEAKKGQPPFVQAEDGTLSRWRPARGEEVGFMASTMTRGGIPRRSVRERSPIVLVRWP